MKDATWNRVEPVSGKTTTAMDARTFFRLSGGALVAGSALCVVLGLFGAATAFITQPVYITSEYLLAAATIVLLLGLPGVYASRAEGFGVTGLIGAVLIFPASIMVGVFDNLYGAMVDPWLATEAPKLASGFGPPPLFAFFNVAEVFLVVGSVLLAIPILRGKVSPRWPATLILLSVVVGVVFFFLIPSMSSTMFTSVLNQVPTILMMAALAGLGYQTWSKRTIATD